MTYENGKQRQDVWSKRSWNGHDINPQEAKPTVLTPEQAKALEQRNLQYRGLNSNNIDAVPNQSRWNDLFNDYGIPSNAHITPQQIYENLTTSNIGKEILSYTENLPERIKLDYETLKPRIYGEEYNGTIKIFIKSCENAERAARTIIHECTHRRYGIGQSQWAESVCFAQELKHKYKRDYLTISEKKRIIKAVKSDSDYGRLNWRKGGMIYGRRKSH